MVEICPQMFLLLQNSDSFFLLSSKGTEAEGVQGNFPFGPRVPICKTGPTIKLFILLFHILQ